MCENTTVFKTVFNGFQKPRVKIQRFSKSRSAALKKHLGFCGWVVGGWDPACLYPPMGFSHICASAMLNKSLMSLLHKAQNPWWCEDSRPTRCELSFAQTMSKAYMYIQTVDNGVRGMDGGGDDMHGMWSLRRGRWSSCLAVWVGK